MINILIRRFTRAIIITLEQFGNYIQENMSHLIFLIIPIVIFLFIIWLVYRIENRAAKEVIYRNFPFFKDAVDSVHLKLEYLITRVDVLEEKINRIESKIK
jgi:pilus assembly protein TadC